MCPAWGVTRGVTSFHGGWDPRVLLDTAGGLLSSAARVRPAPCSGLACGVSAIFMVLPVSEMEAQWGEEGRTLLNKPGVPGAPLKPSPAPNGS